MLLCSLHILLGEMMQHGLLIGGVGVQRSVTLEHSQVLLASAQSSLHHHLHGASIVPQGILLLL